MVAPQPGPVVTSPSGPRPDSRQGASCSEGERIQRQPGERRRFFSFSCKQSAFSGNQCPLTGVILRARNDIRFSSLLRSLPPLAAGMWWEFVRHHLHRREGCSLQHKVSLPGNSPRGTCAEPEQTLVMDTRDISTKADRRR